MKLQNKILISGVIFSVVFALVATVFIVTRPEEVQTVELPTESATSSEWDGVLDLDEDDWATIQNNTLASTGGNSSVNQSVTVSKDPVNTPLGWSSSSDRSKNSPRYKWPTVSPNELEAGIPITKKLAATDDPIGQFVLMQSVNTALPFSVECYISGNKITALLPAGTPLHALKPEFVINGDKLMYGNTEVISGKTVFNFTAPVDLYVVSGNKKIKYTVYIMTLDTGIPSISLNIEGGGDIASKTEYVPCKLFAGGGDTSNGNYAFAKNKYLQSTATIKGRGWTSWYYYPKKSYTLKLDKKQSFLGLPAHKEWVLAANYADRTLMRNAVANELYTYLGAETVMDVRFVDLWVNGEYHGNYQLIEKIEVDPNRVNITKFDPSLKPEEVGYIIETNGHNKAEGEFGHWTNGQDADRPSLWKPLNDFFTLDPISGDIFYSSTNYNGIIFNVNKPSDKNLTALKKDQMLKYLEYIRGYMNDLEKAIKERNYYKVNSLLDLEAMAKWYITEELAMNTDSGLHCSCYMYKDAGGKMKMGPVWDFDLGFGNGKYANENHINKTYLDNTRWFADLLALPQFKQTVKKVWQSSYSKIQRLPRFITDTANLLDEAQEINFELWSITQPAEHTYARTTEQIDSYSEQVYYLRNFTSERIKYMHKKISAW